MSYDKVAEALAGPVSTIMDQLRVDADAELALLLSTPIISTPCEVERLTVQDVMKRHRRRFGSNYKLAKFLGSHHDHVSRVVRGVCRLSLRLAGKWARLLQDPTLVGLVMHEYADGVPSDTQRGDRLSFSSDPESLRHLYDWYMKSLGKGSNPHGSVHHLMGGIYKRLKARQAP